MSSPLLLPISFGEAADKMTILQIKRERIRASNKLVHIEAELAEVSQRFFAAAGHRPGLDVLLAELKSVNQALWDHEDAIRIHECRADFGPEFVQVARSIYLTNDRRARLKREIDLLLDSRFMEEKSYIEHVQGPEERR